VSQLPPLESRAFYANAEWAGAGALTARAKTVFMRDVIDRFDFDAPPSTALSYVVLRLVLFRK